MPFSAGWFHWASVFLRFTFVAVPVLVLYYWAIRTFVCFGNNPLEFTNVFSHPMYCLLCVTVLYRQVFYFHKVQLILLFVILVSNLRNHSSFIVLAHVWSFIHFEFCMYCKAGASYCEYPAVLAPFVKGLTPLTGLYPLLKIVNCAYIVLLLDPSAPCLSYH